MKIEIIRAKDIPQAKMSPAMKAFTDLCKTRTIGVISGANKNDATKMMMIRKRLNLKAEVHYVSAANAITIIPGSIKQQKFVIHGAKALRGTK